MRYEVREDQLCRGCDKADVHAIIIDARELKEIPDDALILTPELLRSVINNVIKDNQRCDEIIEELRNEAL